MGLAFDFCCRFVVEEEAVGVDPIVSASVNLCEVVCNSDLNATSQTEV